MGLFDRIQNLLHGTKSDVSDEEIAEHTVTLAQEARQRWQFLGLREQLLDYVRACIDVHSSERRAELEAMYGIGWQVALRKTYGLDAQFDKKIRDSWHAQLVGGRNPDADPEPFIARIFMLHHLDDEVSQQVAVTPERTPEAIAESYQRKLRSEKRLRSWGVPINRRLPVLESSYETTLRDLLAVRKRAFILIWVACACDAELTSGAEILETLTEAKVVNQLTSSEDALLRSAELTETQRMTLLWKFEAAQALLWAIGHMKLPEPRVRCDQNKVFQAVHHLIGAKGQLALRPVHEVLDEWDYSYRYHWAVKNQLLHPAAQGPEGAVHPSHLITSRSFFDTLKMNSALLRNGAFPMVVSMRHHAFNWLVGYGGAVDWDDVSTDT